MDEVGVSIEVLIKMTSRANLVSLRTPGQVSRGLNQDGDQEGYLALASIIHRPPRAFFGLQDLASIVCRRKLGRNP